MILLVHLYGTKEFRQNGTLHALIWLKNLLDTKNFIDVMHKYLLNQALFQDKIFVFNQFWAIYIAEISLT